MNQSTVELIEAKSTMVSEGQLLWIPGKEAIERSQLGRFCRWLQERRGLVFDTYEALRQWSVNDIEGFWSAIWEHNKVLSDTPYLRVLDQRTMPGAKWFEGSRVNYAEHMLRHEATAAVGEIALHYASEENPPAGITWHELGAQVRLLATRLRELGVQPGDRVVSYMPVIPETAVAMMATIAIGAVWSSAAPEFGVKTVVERFAQIQPKILFAADGYRFGGKLFTRSKETQEIAVGLPTLEHVVWLSHLAIESAPSKLTGIVDWHVLTSGPAVLREHFCFERVASDHPLWIVFSSGTTGLPKAIVHGHQGVLVEHLKLMYLHMNLGPGSAMFFYTTTGWIMWNILLAALLTGSSVVLFDGNPAYPQLDTLWKLAADTGVTCFGASPTYIQMMEKAGIVPGQHYDLSRLESISVSGAPSTPETFEWCYQSVKKDLCVMSMSGGTEVGSGFVGGTPTLPVYAGEIQGRMLGMDVHAWSDDGQIKDLVDAVGELMVTTPFPSMPLFFWNDIGRVRYHDSYFAAFPGVWRHGDVIKINQRGGCYIYGRSDSTLNRYGVRIGTAEIYRAVEQIEGIADSLIVCCEQPGGRFYMPLFITLKPGATLNSDMVKRIASKLRRDCSPRHVPDEVLEVPAVPYTLTGKKMEIPVRKLLMGWAVEKVASPDSMREPAAINWYADFGERVQRQLTAAAFAKL